MDRESLDRWDEAIAEWERKRIPPWPWPIRLAIVVLVIAVPWIVIISGLHWIGVL